MKDRAVTRDLPWGVAVPVDVAADAGVDATGKVLYVWFDAPIGYISATKEWAEKQGKPELWKDYWQNQDTKLIHFIGKDNIVFHCIIFPAMLKAHGDFVLPENVPANEFLNLEGSKLSTSRNYAVWLEEYLQNFAPDSLRYCLASNLPETKDADFSWKDFQARHNNELADILGNFINRTLTFCFKYFDGRIPVPGEFDQTDKALIRKIEKSPLRIGKYLDGFQLRQAVKEMMDLARYANKYFNDMKPWESVKLDVQKCATTIYLSLETVKTLAILFEPVIPFSTKKIWSILNQSKNTPFLWRQAGEMLLKPGTQLAVPEILFQKIEDDVIEMELAKLNLNDNKKLPDDDQKLVNLADFKKLDLRIAEVISAEPVKDSDKLLKLMVKTEGKERQIIAGIAQHYQPDQLVGKKIVIIANLEPAKIRGEISNGMLLAAKHDDQLAILTVDQEIITGSKVS